MTTFELIKKYPNVSPDILKGYKEPEKYVAFNRDDKDLFEFKYKLPDPPEYHKIANFGKPAKDQRFTPPQLPKKLELLVKRCHSLDDIWIELEKNQYFYKKEIKFIKKQWQYLIYGYWVFINGVPTHMDGWHWFYCSWWKIDVGLPKYRSRDYEFFHAARYCYTCTTAIYRYRVFYETDYRHFSNKDSALLFCKELKIDYTAIEEGVYEIDFGRRTIFGFNYPKFRREGATYKGEVINYCIAMVNKSAACGIQSMTDKDAEKVFKKALVSPWKKLPFFFKPLYEGTTDPKSELSFNPPATRLGNKGSKAESDVGLETKIDFAIADGSGYDGQKLLFHHHDEVGKFKYPLDIVDINSTIRECLSTEMGQNIVGLGIKTSTVGKMDEGQGGERFREFCEMSMIDYRDENGHTLTGFINIFIPSRDGIVIDEYGNSIIDDPPKKLVGEKGQVITHGGRTIISRARKALLDAGKFEELAKHKRQFPDNFSECFSTAGGTSKLPVGLIEHRLEQISLGNNPSKVRGDFYWTDGFGSRVEFRPDPLGKWYLSHRLKPEESNQKLWDSRMNSWVPRNKNKFILGVDPFKHNQVLGSKRSEGGGAVFWKRDPILAQGDDPQLWKDSCRFVCTYSNRTFDKEDFAIDMLMTAIYFGAGVFPENNLSEIYEWFIKKGYEEYLIFKVDYLTGKEKATPGQAMANNASKEEMFTEYSTHLTRNCQREVHDELLKQCKQIGGPKETTKYDLFTAGGWALIGAKQFEDTINTFDKEGVSLEDYFPTFAV